MHQEPGTLRVRRLPSTARARGVFYPRRCRHRTRRPLVYRRNRRILRLHAAHTGRRRFEGQPASVQTSPSVRSSGKAKAATSRPRRKPAAMAASLARACRWALRVRPAARGGVCGHRPASVSARAGARDCARARIAPAAGRRSRSRQDDSSGPCAGRAAAARLVRARAHSHARWSARAMVRRAAAPVWHSRGDSGRRCAAHNDSGAAVWHEPMDRGARRHHLHRFREAA